MSATTLLQKAAEMGATSSSSSFLRGLGPDISSSSPASTSSGQHQQQEHHHQEPMQMQFLEGSLQQWLSRLEPEPTPMMSAGLGLGLPYDSTGGLMGLPELMMGQSSLFSAKPATLDFLGLGMSPTGETTSRGLPCSCSPWAAWSAWPGLAAARQRRSAPARALMPSRGRGTRAARRSCERTVGQYQHVAHQL
ncbi:hypothetical protein VPH35_081341 [Triticum aestivum]|uniref:Uncharacterized protein n=1 Tax=Triticum turgidum subsp. durum TaxID=4567 RepID=A0A9R0TKQ2_TRITD|nr:unnamed protein product [Triticum turgidum subsp. durum]